jgi:hypothetical protein
MQAFPRPHHGTSLAVPVGFGASTNVPGSGILLRPVPAAAPEHGDIPGSENPAGAVALPLSGLDPCGIWAQRPSSACPVCLSPILPGVRCCIPMTAPDASGCLPSQVGAPLESQDATLLLAMTAHASATLGKYCRIVVGDARMRDEGARLVRDVVFRWLSSRQDRVALYGRRAWNAHMAQPFLEEPTTDVDMIVLDPDEFQMSRFSLSVALRRGVPDCARLLHTYVKQHQDGRGATMTAELGGVPLIDLSVRFIRGDLCISRAADKTTPYIIPEPHCVLRMIGSRPVSVLRVPVMLDMLAAESRAGTWRSRRAAMQMFKVDAMARAGWLLPDHNSGGGFVSSAHGAPSMRPEPQLASAVLPSGSSVPAAAPEHGDIPSCGFAFSRSRPGAPTTVEGSPSGVSSPNQPAPAKEPQRTPSLPSASELRSRSGSIATPASVAPSASLLTHPSAAAPTQLPASTSDRSDAPIEAPVLSIDIPRDIGTTTEAAEAHVVVQPASEETEADVGPDKRLGAPNPAERAPSLCPRQPEGPSAGALRSSSGAEARRASELQLPAAEPQELEKQDRRAAVAGTGATKELQSACRCLTDEEQELALADQWIDVLRRHAASAVTLDELRQATQWVPCRQGDTVNVMNGLIMSCESLCAARRLLLSEESHE